uniref:site-specific DNA-methyltransferase (cytosine-N(4)-specific) n=1 Tax=viral metagenome TaxID=1070528 RepID=A0A6H1ZW64_9ZZZZ
MSESKLASFEYYRTENGVLYCCPCEDALPHIHDVDLVVTSPPYDNLRTYQGYKFDFYKTAMLLRRSIADGGVIVWVVGDETKNGSESGTSFRQALFFKSIGLNLHDTMIYSKDPMPLTHNRYEQASEYMFVLSKGAPKTFNPLLSHCSRAGQRLTGTRRHNLNDREPVHGLGAKTKSKKYRVNIWHYSPGFNKSTLDTIAFNHPAIFPEALAQDHIISWSNKGDTVLDPMCGSGTTLKMAERLGRKWIGIEISEEYCEIAKQRIIKETRQLRLFN